MNSLRQHLAPLAIATFSERCRVAGHLLDIPGNTKIRWSVIAGNMRLHRLLDQVVYPGDTFVDVGANIGYNTVYARRLVGAGGRVIAIEPAADNLEVLRRQLATNNIYDVIVHDAAAGARRERRDLYLRGDLSGVNSLFPESCYGTVTGTVDIRVEALDDVVGGSADVLKIDVEGAELDVLAGASRILGSPEVRVIVEWHPVLQHAAGYQPDELPRWLLREGFHLDVAWHTTTCPLEADELPGVAQYLASRRSSVELLARRA